MSQTDFVVYGRPWCGYCAGAVRLLKSSPYSFTYIDVYDENISKESLSNKLGVSVRTWPQIVHGDTYVGGYTELVPYLKKLK